MVNKLLALLMVCLMAWNISVMYGTAPNNGSIAPMHAPNAQCKKDAVDSLGEQWVFFKDLQLISTYRGNVTTETVINFANIVPMESKASKIKLVITARDTNQPGNTILSLWTVRISIKNGQQQFVHWQKYGAASAYGVGIGYSETIELPCTQSRQIIVSCSKKMASMAVDFEISGIYK